MDRRILWIVAGALGCVTIAVSSYFLFEPAAPPEVGQTGEEATTQTTPEMPGPITPPVAKANTILSMPKLEDAAVAAALTPTLISLDCEQESAEVALQALSEAAQIQFTMPRGRGPNGVPQVSLHLQNQPVAEAMLQLEMQGITLQMPQPNAPAGQGQAISVQYLADTPWRQNRQPGLWSITGPFAFILTSINHTVPLDRQGRGMPAVAGRGYLSDSSEQLMMQITMRPEPKLNVLRFPMEIDVTEAVDEKGHSLVLPPATMANRTNYVNNVNFPLRAYLAYPPQDPGRTIKTFRGTVTYTVQLDSIPVTIDDPMTTLPSDKTVNGVTAHIEKGVWNEGSRTLDMTVTFKRGTFAGDWKVGTQGLAGIRPRIVVADDRMTSVNCNSSVSGDTVKARYNFGLPAVSRNGRALPAGLPAIQSISFDFPTGTGQVVVPVEFHDLPLP
jgi:hypothetical protein